MSKFAGRFCLVAIAALVTLGASTLWAQVKGSAPAGAVANEAGGSIPGGGPVAPAPLGDQPLLQFCNAAPITINDNAPATPYPSNIAVVGMTGLVSRITVTLNGLSQKWNNHFRRPQELCRVRARTSRWEGSCSAASTACGCCYST